MNTAQRSQVDGKTQTSLIPRRSVLHRKCDCGKHTAGNDQCETCAKNDAELNQSTAGHSAIGQAPPVVQEVLQSSGRSLDPASRAFFEPRFGADLGHVRLHTDAKSAESAFAVNALAYTVGQDIVFAAGRYSPDNESGLALLAHELAHTVQQRAVSHQAARQHGVTISAPDSPAEVQADAAADAVLSAPDNQMLTVPISQTGPMLSRTDCTQYTTRWTCTAGVYKCGYGKSGTCGWGGMNIGCVCMGASQPDAKQILSILLIIGVSVWLLVTIIGALLDPEPVSKLLLAGLALAQIAALLLMLDYSEEEIRDMGLDPTLAASVVPDDERSA